MTSDVFVGGVPNAPEENGYPGGACTEPEGRLGLSVGWGDQYEFTDGGEGINITGVPNGTYWLRGEADPYHYFAESNTANDVTDTKLRIEGETVKVLEQVHPDSTPPAVSLTTPAAESTVSGNVTLTASASGPAPISSVQFLLDGRPIGSPVTSPPYTTSWNVGSTPPGPHYLSAQATDSRGFAGTAPDTPVTVAARVGSITIGKVMQQAGETTVSTAPFSTSQPGQVLLAFVGCRRAFAGHAVGDRERVLARLAPRAARRRAAGRRRGLDRHRRIARSPGRRSPRPPPTAASTSRSRLLRSRARRASARRRRREPRKAPHRCC